MPDLVHTILARLDELFEAHRDPERAVGARAYMRDLFDFYGIPSPEQKRIAREATAGLPAPMEAQLVEVAKACWRRDEREWQYFGCAYLRRHIAVASAGFLETAGWLVTHRSWWDTVDALASRTVGPLVLAYPRLVRTLDRWIRSDDLWLVRTAILHQLAYRSATDADRLFHYCTLRAKDGDFFVRKAIGWALREYSKTDARAVRRFVREHPDLSNLSRTEALKWLERGGARRSIA